MQIPLASKCRCCTNPQPETTDHLFVHSELASFIWSYPAIIQHPTHNLSIEGLFDTWLSPQSMYTLSGFVATAYFLIGLREIRLHRNSIIHEESKLLPLKVLQAQTPVLCYSHPHTQIPFTYGIPAHPDHLPSQGPLLHPQTPQQHQVVPSS